jgi:hypothetical protein
MAAKRDGRELLDFGFKGRMVRIARHDHPSDPDRGEHMMYNIWKKGVKGSTRKYQTFRDQNAAGRWGPR